MKLPSLLALLLLVWGGPGCGKEIGDECAVGSDCSPNGDRQCDTSSKGGYCTVQGCDFNTCPEEAVCVRFFTGSFFNKPCKPACEDDVRDPAQCVPDGGNAPQPTDDCSLDELCSLAGNCVPRSSEIRFCMRTCDSDGDCRDGYECRDLERMKAHGGEPVTGGGTGGAGEPQRFCAIAPSAS